MTDYNCCKLESILLVHTSDKNYTTIINYSVKSSSY